VDLATTHPTKQFFITNKTKPSISHLNPFPMNNSLSAESFTKDNKQKVTERVKVDRDQEMTNRLLQPLNKHSKSRLLPLELAVSKAGG
jgi:hypothetical protein